MANPEYKSKTKTRKGLFGRTITKTKTKGPDGYKAKQRDVTRTMDKGVKTKRTVKIKDNANNNSSKIKTRSFETPEGVGYKYDKMRYKDSSGRLKEIKSQKYDRGVASGPEPKVGSEYTFRKDNMGKSAVENPMHLQTSPGRSKGTIRTYGANPTPTKIKTAKSEIRQARKMSRGRGYYGQ